MTYRGGKEIGDPWYGRVLLRALLFITLVANRRIFFKTLIVREYFNTISMVMIT